MIRRTVFFRSFEIDFLVAARIWSFIVFLFG